MDQPERGREKFFNAGETGLQVARGGIVSDVMPSSQGEDLGIQVGWRITRIHGREYSEKLLEAYVGGKEHIPSLSLWRQIRL
jgi:S1-C subfamily serine protease